MNGLLYIYLVALGFAGGVVVCLPVILKLKAFSDKFSANKARDDKGRFLKRRASKVRELRRELGLN